MKTALLLTVASLASVLGTKPTTPNEEVKTEAAAGRYRRPSYSSPNYGGGYGYPSYGPGYWQPLVQDRFVCDLDASVLLVVDSHRHHHHNNHHNNGYYGNGPSVPANRAVRVKCSEVANHDEDSCNFCCQQTARRDTSLANDKLFGFLAIVETDDDKTFKRDKRGADHDDDDDDDDDDEDRRRGGRRHHHNGGGRFHKVDPTYVVEADWTAPKYHTNVKCVCCAPRTNPAASNPSTYNSPPAANPPSTGYNGGNANTFNTQPVQPFVDSWQSADSGAGANNQWSSGAANTAPVPAGNTWSTGAAVPVPANNNQWSSADSGAGANWSSGNTAAAPAGNSWSNTAAAAPMNNGNTWSSNTAAAAPSSGNTWSSSGSAPAAPPANNNWSNTASDSSANTWGAASSDAAAPAPPPAVTPAPVAASNTY